MEKKARLIIMGLGGALVIILVLLIGIMGQKNSLMKEKELLTAENSKLTARMQSLESGLRDSKNKVSSLQSELDSVLTSKQELERKYDLANKAKDDLIAKMNELKAGGAPQQLQILAPQSDTYWAGVLKAKTDLEIQLGNMSNQLRSLQINNEQLMREKSSLELELSNIRREKEDVRRELEYNKKILDSISQELVRERNDKIQVQESFKCIKSENTVLSRQLESLNARKISLEKRLQELQEGKDSVERQFTEMQTMLTDKISQVNGLREELDAIRQSAITGKLGAPVAYPKKESVELPPIVVRPPQVQCTKETGAPYQGRVLSVVKDSNFVVIDLGQDAGVRIGDTFQVYKGDKSVATVEAMQVRKNISACDIKKQCEAIDVGNTVR